MSKEVFKYQCPTNREDGTTGCFRQSCELCNCAPFHKMIVDPGKVLTEEPKDLKCPHTGVALELVDHWKELPEQPLIIGSKLSENQIRANRMKRSSDHFDREVFKTLPKEDRRALARNRPHLKDKKVRKK